MEQTTFAHQAEVDRLTVAARQPSSVESQLSILAERCAEILNRWTEMDRRHVGAIAELETRLAKWMAIEGRFEQSSKRMQELQQLVEQECRAIRQVHDEPLQRLREQSTALGDVCTMAAQLSLQGFERAEARFAAVERDLVAQLRELTHAVAELRQNGSAPASGGAVAPFPIEGVMRIHEELRASDASSGRVLDIPQAPRTVSHDVELTAPAGPRRRPSRLTLGLIGGFVVVAALVAWQAQRYVSARLDAAAARAAAAERQAASVAEAATRQIASMRQDADRQIDRARDAASKADIVANVLAAPDLLRFSLVGTEHATNASAQLLWSRSRGLVLSGQRLPAAPAGSTYQVWLANETAVVSAGTFVPDSTGVVTMAADNLQNAPRPVNNIIVTLEPAGGRPSPAGASMLVRMPQ